MTIARSCSLAPPEASRDSAVLVRPSPASLILRVEYNRRVRFILLAAILAAACSSRVVVDVALPDGEPAPSGLTVSVYAPRQSLVSVRETRWPDPPEGPKQYLF